MELAQLILRLWRLKLWVAIGIAIAAGTALAGMSLLSSNVYSAASTQMVVDASRSALGDTQTDLTPFTTRAVVFARLMTSPDALQYIGQAARIPGSEIDAQGPAEIGMPQAVHAPSLQQNGRVVAAPSQYVLRFDQNPALPTVDVYSQAPTTTQAVALANGAVTGFSKYLQQLEARSQVPLGARVDVRQLGTASGGIVDPSSSKQLAVLIFVAVFVLWCAVLLFVSGLRAELSPDLGRPATGGSAPGEPSVELEPALAASPGAAAGNGAEPGGAVDGEGTDPVQEYLAKAGWRRH